MLEAQQTQEERNYELIGEIIDPEEGASMVKRSIDAEPEQCISSTIGRVALEKLLAQPGAKAINFYFALTVEKKRTLVYFAVGSDGKAIPGGIKVDDLGALVCTAPIVYDRSMTPPGRTGPVYDWNWIFNKAETLDFWNKLK